MVGLRTIIGGIGAAGAASATVLTGVATQSGNSAVNESDVAGSGSFSLCLKTDLPFFEGVNKGCYQRRDVAEFQDRPVVDNDGDIVAYDVAHPVDHSRDLKTCNTCREYREYSWSGWYAPSSRDMRREAYFVRACGLLEVLADARQAQETYFAAEGLTQENLASLSGGELPQLNEAIAGVGESYEVSTESDGRWTFSSQSHNVVVQEIAYADFDDDGVEDALVFVSSGATDGTASVYDYGFMKLLSEGGPAVYVSKTISSPS